MEAAHLPWRPLGELFVARGLISEAELETALAEQAATNRRLGEILVDRGLVSGPDLTSVLMEQLGVEISKEEGFGSGLWAEIKRRHRRGGRGPDEENGEAEVEADAEFETPFVLLRGGAQDEPAAPEGDLGELEGELEELTSEYTPPPPIEAFTEPERERTPVGELAAEETLEAEEAVGWVEPEQEAVPEFEAVPEIEEPEPVEPEPVEPEPVEPEPVEPEPVEPESVEEPEPVPVMAEEATPVSEADEVAELRAELDAAQIEISHLHEMLADAMTALSALYAEAQAAVESAPRDHDSL